VINFVTQNIRTIIVRTKFLSSVLYEVRRVIQHTELYRQQLNFRCKITGTF